MTRLKTAKLLMICVLALLPACGTRVVLIKPGDPVRLRQNVKKVKVWAYDKDGKPVPSEVDLPEGWYALPDPGAK